MIIERLIGLRSFSRVEFLKEAPRVGSPRDASFTPQTLANATLGSAGSQVEVDFNLKVRNQDQDDAVPNVFMEHRHQYSQKPKDIDAYRRQIYYRCGHIGTKELEIVFRDWLTMNKEKMTYADLE